MRLFFLVVRSWMKISVRPFVSLPMMVEAADSNATKRPEDETDGALLSPLLPAPLLG